MNDLSNKICKSAVARFTGDIMIIKSVESDDIQTADDPVWTRNFSKRIT